MPLISLAVWARCCVACLVELKAALQQGSRLLNLANLPKHFLSRSGAQCVWVAGEGSGHGKPTSTGLHGKSVVRGFRNAISFKSTDLCFAGSCSCSGVDFVCLGTDDVTRESERGSLQSTFEDFDCVVCRKDGSLHIGL